MISDHPDRDDLVAYSLGALDSRQVAEVEAHAPSCARCTRELEALAPAVAVLGESVEQLEPPPELRERVLAILREETDVKPAGVRSTRHARRGLRPPLLQPATVLAALAIAAAGIGGYLIAGDGGGGSEETVPVVAEAGVGGTLDVGDTSSLLDLHGLKRLSGRDVYQVWVARGPNLRPSSNFIPDASGRARSAVDGHLESGTKVMVTREPRPGQTAPTSPILLSATVE